MLLPPRRLASLLASGLLAAACTSLPPPEPARRREPVLVDERVDRAVGTDEAERVAAELGLLDAPALQGYVEAVGRRLTGQVHHGQFRYEFHIVDQPIPNAFALPGGFIYVSRGLVVLANSEDELANVLAHEITHVSARHAAARQEIARTQTNPMMLPGIVLGAVLGDSVGKALSSSFDAFNAPYIARYSREQERTADRGGQELAARAGYDPRGMATFLRSLDAAEGYRHGYSRLPSFLDTHPLTAERVRLAAADAGFFSWSPRPPIAKSREGYLRRVEGLVVGPSAAQGLFRGERFLHPDLGFTLEFPQGWELINTPLAVGAVPPRRDAQVFLSVPTPGDDPRATAEAFLAKNRSLRIRVRSASELKIGSLGAYRVEGTATTPQGRVDGESTWIAYDGKVYRLAGVAPAGHGEKYTGRFQRTVQSFRPLTPEERASVEEQRLRVVKARGGETILALNARTGNVLDLHATASLNGHPPGKPFEPGRLVKIARLESYRPSRKTQ